MKKILVLLIIASLLKSVGAWAQQAPLFATVVNLSKNDVLNVRKAPDYRSRKIGALPLDAYVGVDQCKEIGVSRWCKVHHIAQRDYEEFGWDASPGWVNARYLQPKNRGYVISNGKPNCGYALGCNKGKCEIVDSYETNKNQEIISLKTKWIDRKHLTGSSNFGAMSPDGDGYCTDGAHIEEYLQQKRNREILAQDSVPARRRVISFTKALRTLSDAEKITSYIHPKKGVIMTWNVLFGGKEDLHFKKSDIKNAYLNKRKKIYWGKSYGKGDDVFMSLHDYMAMLTRPISAITRIEKLKEAKGFKCLSPKKCRAYEVVWINRDSSTKEYDWLGLVVILEKFKNEWYVVGVLHDRWTV